MSDRSSDLFAPLSYGLFSIFLWSLFASLADFLTGQVNYLAFTIGIFVCGIVLFGADCYRKRDRLRTGFVRLDRREKATFLSFVFLFGVLLAIYDLTFYFAIQTGPSIPANLINYLWPMLTPIFAVFLFRRPNDEITAYKIGALLLAFLGAIIAVWDFSGGTDLASMELRFSYLAAFVASIAAALYLNALDVAQDYIPSISLTYFLGILFAFPFLLVSVPIFELTVQATADSLPIIVLYGIVVFVGGQFAWGRAITRGNKVVISALAYLTPILSTLFLFVLVDATLTQSMAAGGTLIIVANVLLNDSFRHVSSARGAVIGIFAVSIVLFVDPSLGGSETSIGVFEGFVATIFAILAGFMLERVWRMNQSENEYVVEMNNTMEQFLPILDELEREDREAFVEQIDAVMISILELNYLKDASERFALSRQVHTDINEFHETATGLFAETGYERRATELSMQFRKDVNNWLMLNQEGVSRGEMGILWILGTVTIVLFIVNMGSGFLENVIAIALSGVIIFIILKIRDYNFNRTGTEKALVEQDVILQIEREPYFPSKEMVLDGGYVKTMNENDSVRLGEDHETAIVKDLAPHLYVRYSLLALVGLGISLMIGLIYLRSVGLT
ncbi:DMT family transporter [Natrarchaeobius halalkaliphilus]|uniref:DMT family transporter n=1 Tax=Natrarchaeobius halalkaliphilus TaxID=1679091 RepID=A0A3N6LJR8_9EURY|nr:DMT family transporter [Natrarchaeobius halalkaliphilus]RQG88993.1 DMT family transporter [Natrarchaeobius halalkaliphilus]